MKKISVILATILCVILTLGPLSVARETLFPSKSESQGQRIHLNTANTTRVAGNTSEEISAQISKILYPPLDSGSKVQAIILVQSDRWQDVLSLIQLVKPYRSIVINVGEDISIETMDYIKSARPTGIPELKGVQLLVFGNSVDNIKLKLSDSGLYSTYIPYSGTEELEKIVNNFPSVTQEQKYGFLVSDEDPLMSIPVATWIVNQGGVLLYVNKENNLYSASKEILQKNKLKKVYIVADKKLDGDKVLNGFKLKKERISAANPEEMAIKFAKLNNKEDLVGWNSDREKRDVGHNYILCTKENPMLALIASQLAVKGKTGPILWTDSNRLSPSTENYLWRVKPNYWVTPDEGPYNSVWVIGDNSILDFSIQGRVDYIQEIEPYETMGKQGVSGIELLSIISMAISLCGALWITLHLFLRRRSLSTLTKLIWILTVLILGPIGLWIYIISYVNSPWIKMNKKLIWMRPLWKQALVTTVMGLSFVASIMISIAFLMFSGGLPLASIPEKSGIFLLGNPMVLIMVFLYIVAFVLNLYIFMPTIFMEVKNLSYKHAKKESVLVVFVSITSVFIGMAISIWWLSMVYAPRMPSADCILWWGFMQLSTLIGGIIAYIPNWQLVKYGKKMGTV